MRCTALLASMVLLSASATAIADRALPSAMDAEPGTCPDQPTEPQWMQDINIRESHKRLLVQQIYRAESMQRIVDAGNCSCDTRYPSWDAAESVYFEKFAVADYQDVMEATDTYRRLANKIRLKAMPICEVARNW